MNEQMSLFPDAPLKDEKACYNCGVFAELRDPFVRSDEAVIYGYCFIEGDKDHNIGMGKGYPVFIDGGSCDRWKKRKAAQAGEGERDG